MRIISGKYRGRRLISPADKSVRPTTDMVKESLFNIVQSSIDGAKVLDLFAGSGAIGVEMISRGASEVVMCDIDRKSIEIIKSNLNLIGEHARIIEGDYISSLSRLSGEKFDIIFLDPPYDKGYELDILDRLGDYLSDSGVVVMESFYNKVKDFADKSKLKCLKSRKYGGTALTVFSKE